MWALVGRRAQQLRGRWRWGASWLAPALRVLFCACRPVQGASLGPVLSALQPLLMLLHSRLLQLLPCYSPVLKKPLCLPCRPLLLQRVAWDRCRSASSAWARAQLYSSSVACCVFQALPWGMTVGDEPAAPINNTARPRELQLNHIAPMGKHIMYEYGGGVNALKKAFFPISRII